MAFHPVQELRDLDAAICDLELPHKHSRCLLLEEDVVFFKRVNEQIRQNESTTHILVVFKHFLSYLPGALPTDLIMNANVPAKYRTNGPRTRTCFQCTPVAYNVDFYTLPTGSSRGFKDFLPAKFTPQIDYFIKKRPSFCVMTHVPALQNAAVSTHRPRAFGRTSNVWQYMETVQERMTPLSRQKESTPSGRQLRKTSLDFAEGDDEDDDDAEEKLAQTRQHRGSRRVERPTGPYDTIAAGNAGADNALQKRKLSKGTAAAAQHGSAQYKRLSKAGGMKYVNSLPELHPLSNSSPGENAAKNSATLSQLIAGSKRNALQSAGMGSGVSPNAKKGVGTSTGFNSTEIIKRIQALGTSASMAQIPSLGAGTGATPNTNITNNGQTILTAVVGEPKSGIGALPSSAQNAVPGGAASTAVPATMLSDAEKLRNDFNSQQSKLYYGCSVAFELFNGHLMMIGSLDGQVRVQSLESLQIPQIKGCKDRAIFTLIDLTDVRSANTICYGDAVWLQLSVGTDEVSWEQGGVLGTKVREAPQLKMLALSDDELIRNNIQAPATVGCPAPVKAYLPKAQQEEPRFHDQDRFFKLFALQDEHILDIIKFKERTAQEAPVAEEHARMGLSPLATRFRDRFKHVGLLAQSHMRDYHGIGGQRMHEEEQGVGETFTFDSRTCPIEYPGDGFDVFGNPVDPEASDLRQRHRMLPSEQEMEMIAPIDTKAMMEVYLQNRAAVGEMLEGYVELCETQMIPNLHRAMETYNRGSLVEILEFTARASEFVCARRVQVQVAKLMHEIAESDVGDFQAFEAAFDALLKEFDGTVAFIKFYREKLNAKKKRK
ncbi:hypothetical protein FI667_g15319, partial [Globisporangium splendens]